MYLYKSRTGQNAVKLPSEHHNLKTFSSISARYAFLNPLLKLSLLIEKVSVLRLTVC